MADTTIRFFCDETDMALGKGLATLRADVVHPGHPDLPEVPTGAKDPDWIPIIGTKRMLVITRDKNMRKRPGEGLAWRRGELRGFVLTGGGQQDTWASVRVLARWWDEMEKIADERPAGPWMYAVTEDRRPREMDLPRREPAEQGHQHPSTSTVVMVRNPKTSL